jgi:hypothetical protein
MSLVERAEDQIDHDQRRPDRSAVPEGLRPAIIVVSTARRIGACCKARFDFKARCVASLIPLARFSKISRAAAIGAFTNQSERSCKDLRFCTGAPYHVRGRFSEKANQSMSIKLRIMSAMKRLEDDLRIDPSTIAEDAAFPQTVGGFIKVYENVPA